MTATIELHGIYGTSPGTPQSVDQVNWRFTTDDLAPKAAGTTNPLIIPTAGSNYSFWKTYRANCTVSPVGTVNNLRFYTDGSSSLPSNYFLNGQIANVGADAGYRQASGTVGLTGLALTGANHTGLIAEPVDVFGWTSGSPLALTGSISNPTTGLFGDHVITQYKITTGASAATITAETATLIWDET